MTKYGMFIIAALLANACSPEIRVYSDHDPDFKVESFQSFDWAQIRDIENKENPLYYNELNDKRIKAAIYEQLASRGYSRSEVDPELVIHYHIVIDDQSVVSTEPFGYTYGPYWVRMQTNVYPYREGTLIIDLMDTKTNSLVWRGWATTSLDSVAADQTEEIINRVVAKIFKGFPDSARSHSLTASTSRE